jgi:hypothetical protein
MVAARARAWAVLCCAIVLAGLAGRPAAGAEPGSAPAPSGAADPEVLFALGPAEIDAALAPIALYPDDLLAQVLLASTYPLDIVEADRWLAQHGGWSPDALEAAAQAERWDASVKALLPFPQMLALLDQNIGWTEELGELFLAQRADVAASIQRLRERASEAGTLRGTPEQQVTREGDDLVIAPTNADVVYIPSYQPEAIFGADKWPAGPPTVLAPPPGGIWVGPIYWSAPVSGAGWLWAVWNWREGSVTINLPRYNNNPYNPHRTSPLWGFVPAQRHGVPYRLASLRSQYRPVSAAAAVAKPSPADALDVLQGGTLLAWPSRTAPGLAPRAGSPPLGAGTVPRAVSGAAAPLEPRPAPAAVRSQPTHPIPLGSPAPGAAHPSAGASGNAVENQK